MLSLADLPAEVTAMLPLLLDSQAFFNLRLTSKELNFKTKNYFTARFFKTRYHMLSRESLATLFEISRDPILSLSVHNLEISIHHLIDDIPSYQPGSWDRPGDWQSGKESDVKAFVDQTAYGHYLEDQKILAECGLDTVYLARILINLGNCKSICISDTSQPWGARLQQGQIGISPTTNMWHESSVAFVKRTIRVVLAAITTSDITLDYFGISTGYNRKAPSPEQLPLQQQIHLRESIPQPTQITYLFLTINPEESTNPDMWDQHFLQFMKLFTSIRQFGLSFHPHDDYGRLHSISSSLELECLEFLSIAEADCSEEDLEVLFLRHKYTISEIHLDMVNIIEGQGSWASLESTVERVLSIEQFIHRDHD